MCNTNPNRKRREKAAKIPTFPALACVSVLFSDVRQWWYRVNLSEPQSVQLRQVTVGSKKNILALILSPRGSQLAGKGEGGLWEKGEGTC